MNNHQPLPTGIGNSLQPVLLNKRQVEQVRLFGTERLADLSGDYKLMTHGLVETHGSKGSLDLLGTYNSEFDTDLCLPAFRLENRVFAGIDLPGQMLWDYMVFAVPLDEWPRFYEWMGSIAFHDPSKNLLTRVRPQKINVLDPRAIEFGHIPSVVEVICFCLETSAGSWYFNSQTPPKAIFDPTAVWQDTKNLRQNILSGKSDIYGVNDES